MTIAASGALSFNQDITITGATPLLTIGDAGEEDTAVYFNGNAQDYIIGVDDTYDILSLQNGSALSGDGLNIDSSQRVLIGDVATRAIGGQNPSLQIIGTGIDDSRMTLQRFQANDGASSLDLGKSRGASAGTYTIVQDDDKIGQVRFLPADGTDMATIGAEIFARVNDASPAADDIGVEVVISTHPGGGGSLTENFRVLANGTVGIGDATAASGSEKLRLISGVDSEWAMRVEHTDADNPQGIVISYTGGAPNGTGDPFLQATDTSATRFQVRSNGGIANYQSNDVDLSDINSKENITSTPSQLDFVKGLKFKDANYKDDPDQEKSTMLMAQDLEELDPTLVTESNWGTSENPIIRKEIYPHRIQQKINKVVQELVVKLESAEQRLNNAGI
jgi:hypothetical protein